MNAYTLDPARSTVILRTRAGGLFSALAHDLELQAPIARGSAQRDGDRWEGELAVSPSAIKVVGVIKRGNVDKGVLSASDVRDIEGRVANEIFAGTPEIIIRGSGTLDAPSLHAVVKREAPIQAKVSAKNDDAARVIHAKGTVSIKGLGLSEVKGPLGAFVIKDDVEIEAIAFFAPA